MMTSEPTLTKAALATYLAAYVLVKYLLLLLWNVVKKGCLLTLYGRWHATYVWVIEVCYLLKITWAEGWLELCYQKIMLCRWDKYLCYFIRWHKQSLHFAARTSLHVWDSISQILCKLFCCKCLNVIMLPKWTWAKLRCIPSLWYFITNLMCNRDKLYNRPTTECTTMAVLSLKLITFNACHKI